MEYEEKKREDKEASKAFGVIMAICFVMIFFPIIIHSCEDKRKEATAIKEESLGNIKVRNSGSYRGENHEFVENTLRDLGFTNIVSKELSEKSGAFSDPGDIKEITIDGLEQWNSDSYFPKDASIRIYYYKE